MVCIIRNIPPLEGLKISRRLLIIDPDYISLIQIHAFADSSQKAYAVCVYVRSFAYLKKATPKNRTYMRSFVSY